MFELKTQVCEACRVGAPTVSDKEAAEFLRQLSGWTLVREEGVAKLRRQYAFRNFRDALAFTNRVGEMAEGQGHHPDLLTRWGAVEVTWWTHKIRGLHQNDFICAARSNELYSGG